MTREKAIEKIFSDLRLPNTAEDYILQTIGRLGCDENMDMETVLAIEQVIKREIQ